MTQSNSNNILQHRRREEKNTDLWGMVLGDGIADCFSIHDRDFRIIKTNTAFVRAFGQSEEKGHLIGRKCYEVVHGSIRPPVHCPHLEAMEKKSGVVRELSDENTGIKLFITVSPIVDDSNQIIGSIHIMQGLLNEGKKRISLTSPPPISPLTERQIQVLQLLCEGRSVKEIAFRLKLSPRTVEFHKYTMINRLGTTTLTGLIRYAIAHEIVT